MLIFVFHTQMLALLGRSDDLTGRVGIWDAVIHLASQRPVAGWGWVSYWAPWAAPFDHLAVIKGVTYLQAHEAWLDIWFQLGIIGIVVFATLILTTFGRSWLMAIDHPGIQPGTTVRYSALTLLPVLVLTALLVQSLAESRLLIESNWMLLAAFAVKTKLSPLAGEHVR
jgi:exopolysaccharide production protein ExoQ